jgi:hypothetical protein
MNSPTALLPKRETRHRKPGLATDVWLAVAVAVTFLCFLAEALTLIVQEPSWAWNDIRLSRSLALLHGYRPYYGPHENAPLIGTMHTPFSYLFYLPLGFFRQPAAALLAGSCLSFVLVFAPLLWLHLSGRQRSIRQTLWCLCAWVMCGLVAAKNPGTRFVALSIHTDAAAFLFITLAAGLLYRPSYRHSDGPLMFSALFAALAVASKQTLFPLFFALALFVWVADGAGRARRYLLWLLVASVAVCAFVLWRFGPLSAMLFNVVTLVAHSPATRSGPWGGDVANVFRALRESCTFGFLLVLVFLISAAYRRLGTWREVVAENRWLVFFVVAVAMLPVTIKACLTEGGSWNHVALVSYFLLVSGSLALCDHLAGNEGHRDPYMRPVAQALIAAVILLTISPLNLSGSIRTLKNANTNPSQAAFEYLRTQPGKAYFPWNPLPALLAEGKLYHLDYTIYDREIRGYPLTDQQFESNIPPSCRLVAFPPEQVPKSAAIRRLIAGAHQISEPRLPGFIVFELPPRGEMHP